MDPLWNEPWNKRAWSGNAQWQESSPPAKQQCAQLLPSQHSWGDRYMYLTGHQKTIQTLPERAWLAREMVAHNQSDKNPGNVVKLPLGKILNWQADEIATVIFMLASVKWGVFLCSLWGRPSMTLWMPWLTL